VKAVGANPEFHGARGFFGKFSEATFDEINRHALNVIPERARDFVQVER